MSPGSHSGADRNSQKSTRLLVCVVARIRVARTSARWPQKEQQQLPEPMRAQSHRDRSPLLAGGAPTSRWEGGRRLWWHEVLEGPQVVAQAMQGRHVHVAIPGVEYQ